jgi:hypothetical protein
MAEVLSYAFPLQNVELCANAQFVIFAYTGIDLACRLPELL